MFDTRSGHCHADNTNYQKVVGLSSHKIQNTNFLVFSVSPDSLLHLEVCSDFPFNDTRSGHCHADNTNYQKVVAFLVLKFKYITIYIS